MNLQLERPIVFFDLETTGINLINDRILQIGAIKVNPDGTEEVKNVLINPTIPIPAESTMVHGISDEKVKDAPMFSQIAKSFHQWLQGCDLAGFNSDNFDIPLLAEEFLRVGIEYPDTDTHFIDMIKIERLVNSHRLDETYKRYTGQTLVNAHDALADIEATIAIFAQQLERNPEFQVPVAQIEAMCQGNNKKVDFAGKIYIENGEYFWNFGKHYGQRILDTLDYVNWVMGAEFTRDTKRWLRKIVGG